MDKSVMMTDIKRALTGKGFVAGAAGTIGVIAVSSLESLVGGARNPFLRQNGYHAQLITNALSGDALMMALPVLCALPFAAAFVDDMKSGFIKPFLHRAGTASYIKGKLIACGLSGGLVLFVGIVLAYGLSALVFIPLEQPSAPRIAEQAYIAANLDDGNLLRHLRRALVIDRFCHGCPEYEQICGLRLAFYLLLFTDYPARTLFFRLFFILSQRMAIPLRCLGAGQSGRTFITGRNDHFTLFCLCSDRRKEACSCLNSGRLTR
ncbi:MAG: hypothetical protein VB070_14860 [Clostridiaceae bacterium]|nr:hypothetical protein [Clostridiaceae bacterium]